MGLGAFPGSHKNCLGMLGMHGTYEANMAMHNSDLIFGIGVRLMTGLPITSRSTALTPLSCILILIPSSISKTIAVDIPIVGSADTVLNSMLKLLDDQSDTSDEQAIDSWWSEIESWRARKCLSYNKSSERIKPQEVIEVLYKLTEW